MFPKFNVVSVPNIALPLAVRPAASSANGGGVMVCDERLLKVIFVDQEYLLPIKNFEPKLIIDCGANIGYASVYFANQYPSAKIVAVEPERGNYKMLTYNTNFYDNISCIQSAMWNKETYIRVERQVSTEDFMTFETTADDPNALKTITVGKILADSGFDSIDLLKVDIEGAEKEVFGADDVHEWLSKTKVIAIELHDRYKRGCSSAFFRAVSKYDFYFTQRGENLFFIRDKLLI